ncbi:MAG: ATP-dependent DNA helicase RecG, partial [Lachnospiraceae bacterium]|nr:ATP-dependent DNA helicase RecG [Lachnospiraceae bacterium]
MLNFNTADSQYTPTSFQRSSVMQLNDPITSLKGVGEKTAALYHKLGIFTIDDLIKHYPRDYQEWRDIVKIGELRANQVHAIHAFVISAPQTVHIRQNMSITTVRVKDSSGACDITYFNMPYIRNTLLTGKQYIFRGRVVLRNNRITIDQPKIVSPHDFAKNVNRLAPVYATTKGLTIAAITKAMHMAIDVLDFGVDYLPESMREEYGLPDLKSAILGIHFPQNRDVLIAARKRLVFEEFLFFIVSVMFLKDMTAQEINDAPMMRIDACQDFIDKLPYELTGAQKKVWAQIEDDLCSTHLMNRLVQGDVGSGKTIVAILAMFMCIMNHHQAAFMAPTEVLARQHYESILELIENYGLPFKPILLTGSLTAKEKRRAKESIVLGTCNVIIGTQALLQDDVDFYDLRLVITDEQHRFGVKQRETFAQKGIQPHILVMSATPIPRTLALILYGDLDISVMDELPANRLPVKNCVVNTDYRKKAYEFIAKEVANGRQAYVICPMVEANDEMMGDQPILENVIEYTEKLKKALPDTVRVEYLHGQMNAKAKNFIMEEYAAHHIDVLVSTTVIEVGINVPNATVMLVENSERFGLAQLHQLRGRVGRGKNQSYCIFITTSSQNDTMERLQVLNKSNDGFFISSEDMRLRGPGDLFGIRQSGQFEFQLGDIYQDANILQEAQSCAGKLYTAYIQNEKSLDENQEYHVFWEYYEKNIASNVDCI